MSFTQISNWARAPAPRPRRSPRDRRTPRIQRHDEQDRVVRATTAASTGPPTSTRSAAARPVHGRLDRLQQQPRASRSSTARPAAPPTGVILGGTQDNGTLKYTPATGTTWTTEFGGDGGASAVDPSNNDNLYGEYVYGAVHRSTDGGASADWINGLVWNGVQYDVQAGPVCDRRHVRRVDGRTSSRRSSSIRTTRTAARRRPVAVADQRRDDAEHARRPGRRGPASRRRAGAGNYISAIAVAARQFQRRSGSGTTTGSCSRPPTARRARRRGRASGAGTLPESLRDARARRSDRRQHRLRRPTAASAPTNVWKTTNGGDLLGVRVGHRRRPALPAVPVRDIAIYPPQPDLAVCRDRSRPVHQPGRRRHVERPAATARRTSRSKSCSGWARASSP